MLPERGLKTSPAEVQKFLKGIRFPASKWDLIQHAEDNGAPVHVLDALDAMPDKQYESAADVAKGFESTE